MKKKSTFFNLFAILIILSIYTGCKKDNEVSIICTDISQFESDLGIINVGQKSLGHVLLIDTVSKRVFRLGSLNLLPKDIDSSTRRDSIVMLSTTKFETQLSGAIANAEPSIKAEISSTIKNNTTFFLSNCIRKDIESPSRKLSDANKIDSEKYSSPLNNNKNTIIAVITSMTYADKFEFRLQKKSDVNVKVNTMTIGNYNLSLNYSCQNSLNINAKQDGIFYKVTYFTIDSNIVKLIARGINLNEYKMAENAIE